MTKYYPEIVLIGKNFSPQKIMQMYPVNLEMANEKDDYNGRINRKMSFGYAILRPRNNDITSKSIKSLIDDFKMIIGGNDMASIGVEEAQFNLLIGTLQNGATFFSSDIQEICKMFTEFSITFYEYDQDPEYMEE